MRISLIICLSIFWITAQSQVLKNASNQPVTRQTLIKLDLFSPVYDMLNIEVERKLSEESSWTAELLIQREIEPRTRFIKTGGRLFYRYYLNSTPAPVGLYVAGGIGVFDVKQTDSVFSFVAGSAGNRVETVNVARATEAALFVFLGKQAVFKNRISLDLGIGAGYTLNPINSFSKVSLVFDNYGLYGNLKIGLLIGKP
jgi:hypothetical protein